MKKRQIIIVISAVILIVIAFLVSRVLSNQKKPTSRKSEKKGKNGVQILKVHNRSLQANIPISGKLISAGEVEVYSEVTGKLLNTGKLFKEGVRFRKGEVIAQIDMEEARFNILAQKANLQNTLTQMMPDLKLDFTNAAQKWLDYLNDFNIKHSLKPFPKPESDKESYFLTTKGIYNQYYNIKAQEERLKKYSITAPFSGIVTESSIYPGTVVRTNQKLGTMMQSYTYELDASVSLQDIDFIRLGANVNLFSQDLTGGWEGTIDRISDRLDENTQSIKIFVRVSGKRLKEGMYLQGGIAANQISGACIIPRNLVINNKEVYTISNNKLKLKQIELVRYEDNKAIIRGLSEGSLVLNDNISGAYEGMKVNIINK